LKQTAIDSNVIDALAKKHYANANNDRRWVRDYNNDNEIYYPLISVRDRTIGTNNAK